MNQQSPVKLHDAVVFDLDGTLIDSAPDIHAAINHVLADDGLAPLALPLVTSFIGNGVARLVEQAYRHHDALPSARNLEKTVARFTDVYTENAAVLTRPYPGVVGGLEALKQAGIRLGVCTNKPRAISKSILDALAIGNVFDVVIGGDSCARKKPDPAPLLACLDALGTPRARAVYIGDSETDVRTARAAGVAIIAVTYGYVGGKAADLGADAVTDCIDRWVSEVTRDHARRSEPAAPPRL